MSNSLQRIVHQQNISDVKNIYFVILSFILYDKLYPEAMKSLSPFFYAISECRKRFFVISLKPFFMFLLSGRLDDIWTIKKIAP